MEFGHMELPPEPNIRLWMGDKGYPNAIIMFEFHVKRNLANRFKYWLFCLFSPFKGEWIK